MAENVLQIKIEPTIKQNLCWHKLKDKTTKFLLFGGGRGGAKSWLVCEWLISMCLAYPGIKTFIGRNELKRLMLTTYITFQKVCKFHNIPCSCWSLNGQLNYIEFWNGSKIDLLDVAYQPRDTLYERFGSTEYTIGALEEVGEIKEKAFDALKGSIGRHLNKEYGIMSKILLTCNPKKNWVYTDFYKPWKVGALPENKCFIQSLYKDNPFTAKEYGENLESIKDPVLKQRLKYGIWEYEEGEDVLMKFDNIIDIFSNQFKEDPESEFYLSVDPARFGKDKAVLILWQGLYIRKIWWYPKSSIDYIKQKILSKQKQYFIPMSHIVIDEGGCGGGLVDDPELYGVKGFVDASSPVKEEAEELQETKKYNYKNLRAQCFFKLAEYVNNHKIGCYDEIDSDVKTWITEELETVRRKDAANSETTLQIIPKDSIVGNQVTMKDLIGRSPDFADTMKMRMIFELGKSTKEFAIEW